MKTVNRIRCLGCGRRVKDDPQAKTSHIVRYHPEAPLKRIIGLFSPELFEKMGYRIGEHFKTRGWV